MKSENSMNAANEAVAMADVEKAMQAKAEALLAKAKEAAKAAKQAAKEAKEAAKKAKAFAGRPRRTSYYVAYISGHEDAYINKSDVHYCVEKSAIDEAIRQRDENEPLKAINIYKVAKDDENCENKKLISIVYVDDETKQIIID